LSYTITDLQDFKRKALKWASSFEAVCYLDSNSFDDRYSKFNCLFAVGVKDELIVNAGDAFEQLEDFRKKHTGWLTGFLGYDLKNETERITSANADHLGFPDLYFFAPKIVIKIKDGVADITADNPMAIFEAINSQTFEHPTHKPEIKLTSRFSKSEYIDAVERIREHIKQGDIYVTNFCQEFFAENVSIDPLDVFLMLNEVSPNPFAFFFKFKRHYIMSASPERFLAKRGTKLISQPIKGTARRGFGPKEDEAIKLELKNTAKELQENVMIVDLVRNDLTKSAKKGSVKTEELFGIYTFQQLHQMISTVVCEIDDNLSPIRAIKNAFPMGSMTGAPKLRAMQLMEQFERSKRGVYSGAAGYFSPDGDFDFNVVIRTLLYNQQNKYLSFHAGSAITFNADAEKEYEECLLKAQAVFRVLGGSPKISPDPLR
jgi:para-aminobenzoate synthetase component I